MRKTISITRKQARFMRVAEGIVGLLDKLSGVRRIIRDNAAAFRQHAKSCPTCTVGMGDRGFQGDTGDCVPGTKMLDAITLARRLRAEYSHLRMNAIIALRRTYAAAQKGTPKQADLL